MVKAQWEYCELLVSDEGECIILFCHRTLGYLKHYLPEQEDIRPYPLASALALLGQAGWELVTLQHRTVVETDPPRIAFVGSAGTRVRAYLKRPVVAGRSVDEPKLFTATEPWL